jgi:hypothetical protein
MKVSSKLSILALCLPVLFAARVASAVQGDCCQPLTNGNGPTASDCLFILKVAVGSEDCEACVCSPDGNANVTASDALLCLKKAVGQSVTLQCESCNTTTTTLPGGANIGIVNDDDNGEGFNDPAARAPVGGNNGTTLGQQRLNVFEFAADLWEQVVQSNVDIHVSATFDTLFCNSTSAVLGSAGAENYYRDFPNAPLGNTWFPAALANKLRGSDIDAGAPEIVAQFNSAIGTTCPFPNVWYYGLDGNPPVGQIDLVTVVLHEIGHGLGFATIVTLSNGAKGGGTGFDDSFMLFLENHDTPELYPDMTNAERVTASRSGSNLHFTGPAVVAGSTHLLAGRHSPSGHVRMYGPNPQEPGSSVSHWDTVLSPNELMEPSYTGPLHDVGLMRELFEDTFWGTLP